MNTRRLVLPLCGALVALAVPGLASASPDPQPEVRTVDGPVAASSPERVARGLIVRTVGDVSSSTLRRAASAVAGDDAEVADATRATDTLSTVTFDEPVAYDDAAQIAADLQRRADVVAAMPDGRVQATATAPVTTNDPSFAQQYQVWDKRFSSPVGGYSVKAPALWKATRGSSSVVVAVLDTGILKNHPDLKNQLVAGYDLIGADQDAEGNPLPASTGYRYYTANDGNGRDADPSDPGDWVSANDEYCYGPDGNDFEASSWHGSHVAGIIAAQAGNKTGITGIAPKVKVEPVRVLGKCGGWDSDILAGITWASGGAVKGVPANRHPADVINMSLGGQTETIVDQLQACSVYGPVISGARSRGTTIIAAAGNDLGNADLSIPSSCAGVVSVGATSETGHQAFYSNEGSTVDISAPGGDQVVDKATGYAHGVLSTVSTGTRRPGRSTYVEYQGTSMATPAVAAGAALLRSLGVTGPDAIETALTSAVSPFRYDAQYSDVVLKGGGQTYHLDLNCTTSTCGAGILDLSKVPAPTRRAAIVGTPAVGQTLSVSSAWTGPTVDKAYTWLRDGVAVEGATASTYMVQEADRGHRLSVRVGPAGGPFAGITTRSASTDTVGLTVSTSGLPSTTTYGRSAKVAVAVRDESGPRTGTVALKRGSTTLVSKTATSGTDVVLTVPGTAWAGGRNAVRAVFTSGSQGAESTASTVTVRKATPRVTRSVASRVSHTARARLTARVVVAGVRNPRGVVRVYDGSRKIAGARLSATGRGGVVITLPRLKKGKHRIKVVFAGTSVVAKKSSTTKTVTSR